MAPVQKLPIHITAVDKTKKVFKAVTASLNSVRKAVFSFKASLVAVAGSAGIGLLVKSSLDSIDALGKTATKLGVTTEALARFRFAAKLSGVGVNTTDMAVQRFTRRLAEAANGTGEAKDALKELNLDAKSLQQLPLDKQMLALSDAFAGVENSSDRVRLAFKLFDSEGVSLVSTLQDGSVELKKLLDEADDLGIVLSANAVRGVERANDAIAKLFSGFKGVRDQIVAAFAPALEALADGMTNAIKRIKEDFGGFENFAKIIAITIINFVREAARAVVEFFNMIANKAAFVAKKFDQLGISTGDTEEKLRGLIVDVSVLDPTFDNLIARINGTIDASKELRGQTSGVSNDIGKAKDALSEYADAAKNAELDTRGLALKGIKALEDGLVGLISGTLKAKDAFRSMALSIVQDLIRMQIQRQITGPIAGALDALIPSPTPKAIGGPVQRGQPYMVGERGPELFVPSQAGHITRNKDLAGPGGVQVVNNINISTGVSQTVRAEIMELMPQISESTKAAVLDARRRGGTFSAAFG